MAGSGVTLNPTENVYVIDRIEDLPDEFDRYRIYHLLYNPSPGLYYSPDGLTLVQIYGTSNLIVTGDLTVTGDGRIDGNLTVGGEFLLTDSVWDDLRFPASAVNPPGQASDPDFDTVNGGWLFASNGTELVFLMAQMPHQWVEGTAIYPHVHWQKTTSAGGDVLWRLEYKMAPIGEVMDSSFTALDVSTVVDGTPDLDTANQHLISAFASIDMTGRDLSDMLVMKFSRIGSDGDDTYGADARMLEFDIHFEIDSLGSAEEFSQIPPIVVPPDPPDPPTPGSWPAYGAHSQAGYNVSSYPINFETDPYRTWNSKKDIIIAQHRYPYASQVASEVASNSWMKTQNTNIKTQYYTFKSAVELTNSNSAKYLSKQCMDNNGAYADWRGYDSSTGGAIVWTGDVAGDALANTNYGDAGMAAGSSEANFAEAWWTLLKAKYSDQWPWDGYFWDSTDFKDNKPGYVLESDPLTDANPDYKRPFSSGDTDPALFRAGLVYDADMMRTVGPGTLFHTSNGGRDADAVNVVTSANNWAGVWDMRLSENAQTKLGLVTTSTVVNPRNEWSLIYNNCDSRMAILLRAMHISEQMVNLTSTNNLGKGTVVLDFICDWSTSTDPIPTTMAEIPQDHWEACRFICGMAALHDSWMAAPHLTRGIYPFPYMDEFIYDPGEPVGGTPSIGSIDGEDLAFPLTVRTADQAPESGSAYGVFWQEYDNVLWVVNMNEPTGLAAWPQATEDTITLPSAGSGNVWRYPSSTYSNINRTTGGVTAENQSPLVNDGSLTGATIDMKRWTARMLVRSAS